MKTVIVLKGKETIESVIANAKPGQIVVKDSYGKVKKVVTKCEEETKTEQGHKESCQIKRLLTDVERQGLLRAGTRFEGEMDDFPHYDFQEAQFMIAKAKTMFEELPSGIRKKFDNDPIKFVTFANDPKNVEAMKEMGLGKGIDGITADGQPTVDLTNATAPKVEEVIDTKTKT